MIFHKKSFETRQLNESLKNYSAKLIETNIWGMPESIKGLNRWERRNIWANFDGNISGVYTYTIH